MPTIMLIDDSLDYRTNLADMLRFENYHIQEAENGLDGLQMIRRFLPDLIICDLDMPVMHGMDVLKTVKADPIYAKIPFVVATGRTDRLTKQALLDLGADTCLTKPVTVAELLMTIRTLLDSTPDHPNNHVHNDHAHQDHAQKDHAIERRINPSEGGGVDHGQALYSSLD